MFPEPVKRNITNMVVSMLRQAQQPQAQPPQALVVEAWLLRCWSLSLSKRPQDKPNGNGGFDALTSSAATGSTTRGVSG